MSLHCIEAFDGAKWLWEAPPGGQGYRPDGTGRVARQNRPEEAEGEGCDGPTLEADNDVRRDFGRNLRDGSIFGPLCLSSLRYPGSHTSETAAGDSG